MRKEQILRWLNSETISSGLIKMGSMRELTADFTISPYRTKVVGSHYKNALMRHF